MDAAALEPEGDVLASRSTAQAFLVLLSAWMIVGNFCTVAVVLKILERKKRKISDTARSTTWVILSLSACEFVGGFVSFVAQLHTGGDYGTISPGACRVYASFLTFSAIISVQLVFLLGFVRYRILMRKRLEKNIVFQMIVSSIMGAVVSALLIGIAGTTEPGPGRSYCFFAIGQENVLSAVFSWLTVVSCVMPFVMLSCWYLRGFCNLKADEKSVGIDSKYSNRVAWMGFTFVVTYLLCILPWTATVLYRLVAPADEPIPPNVDSAAGAFVFVNFAVNPILYFAFQREYVQTLKQLLLCRKLSSLRSSWQSAAPAHVSSISGSRGSGSANTASCKRGSSRMQGSMISREFPNEDQPRAPNDSSQDHGVDHYQPQGQNDFLQDQRQSSHRQDASKDSMQHADHQPQAPSNFQQEQQHTNHDHEQHAAESAKRDLQQHDQPDATNTHMQQRHLLLDIQPELTDAKQNGPHITNDIKHEEQPHIHHQPQTPADGRSEHRQLEIPAELTTSHHQQQTPAEVRQERRHARHQRSFARDVTISMESITRRQPANAQTATPSSAVPLQDVQNSTPVTS